MRIIDCHAHFGEFSRVLILHRDAESMIKVMDAAGVEAACISSFLSIGPDCEAGNDMVADAVRRFPDRFIGYAVVNPNRPAEIRTELERCFDKLGMTAIKIHPAFHRYPVEGSAYRRVFEFAAERKLAILSHEWGSPQFLRELSTTYPEIRFIVAHVGFWNGREDFNFASVLREQPNVFVDLVYSNIYYQLLERLVTMVGAEKILWGSDFPLHDMHYQLGRLLFAKLPEAQKRLIAGETVARILGR